MTNLDKEYIRGVVTDAISTHFAIVSFCDVIDDIHELSDEQKEWAKVYLTWEILEGKV